MVSHGRRETKAPMAWKALCTPPLIMPPHRPMMPPPAEVPSAPDDLVASFFPLDLPCSAEPTITCCVGLCVAAPGDNGATAFFPCMLFAPRTPQRTLPDS